MPSIAERIRASGWRQGSIVTGPDAHRLLRSSIDRVAEQDQSQFRLIVVSQDCDLVAHPNVEPYVELILCTKAERDQSLHRHGRNPRQLQIQMIGAGNDRAWFDVSVHDRFRVPKEELASVNKDKALRLENRDARALRRWLAKRYTRPAFPDAFNRRLQVVDRKLESLFKSRKGRVVTGIYVDVVEAELPEGTPYEIVVRATAYAHCWERKETSKLLEQFEERLAGILDDCPGIDILEDDIRVMPEDDLTVADLRNFKRLDRDYRSLAEESDTPLPIHPADDI